MYTVRPEPLRIEDVAGYISLFTSMTIYSVGINLDRLRLLSAFSDQPLAVITKNLGSRHIEATGEKLKFYLSNAR